MELLIEKKAFQSVIFIKDNRVYMYNVDENPCFLEDDHALIKCFLVKNNGDMDFDNPVEIYGKYLVDAE